MKENKNTKKLLIALFVLSAFSSFLFAQATNNEQNPYSYTPDTNAQYGYGVQLSSIPQNAVL